MHHYNISEYQGLKKDSKNSLKVKTGTQEGIKISFSLDLNDTRKIL